MKTEFLPYKPEEKIPYLGPKPKSLDLYKILKSCRIKSIPGQKVQGTLIKPWIQNSN